MNSGKLEAVHSDHRKKIGSMPQHNCDPALTPLDPRSRVHMNNSLPNIILHDEHVHVVEESPPAEISSERCE